MFRLHPLGHLKRVRQLNNKYEMRHIPGCCNSFDRRSSLDVLLDSSGPSSSDGRVEYSGVVGMSRIKRKELICRQSVPSVSRRRYPEMSEPKAKLATAVKTNALNPNADNGNAVAVPR